MVFQKKAQAAVEFLMIVGIALTMIMPAVFMFQQFSSEANEKVITGQINSFGREIVNNVESMYYFGEFSKTTLRFNFPDNIINVRINPPLNTGELYEFVITAYMYGGYTDFVYYSKIPIANETTSPTQYESSLAVGFDLRSDAFVAGMKTFRLESVKDKSDQRLKVKINRILYG